MAYSEQVLQRAIARLNQAKVECEAETEARREEIFRDYPRLREIEIALRRTAARAVAAAFRRGEDPTAAIEAIRDENLALQREQEWILEAAELDESALEPTVVCAHCGGSGYVGAVMCECLQELCRQEQKRELSSLLGGREHFDQFRVDYYPTEPDSEFHISPREVMVNVFNRCKRYAATFTTAAPSLLFAGAPGLGKTFLSACIARSVSDSGYSVVYDTVSKMVSDFEAVRFGGNKSEPERKYLSCDLLIIDDLGTEMTTQFTQAVLYEVINTRLMENRPTIVSTNLDDAGLRQRYTPAIASRLLGVYETHVFIGRDIRLLKR